MGVINIVELMAYTQLTATKSGYVRTGTTMRVLFAWSSLQYGKRRGLPYLDTPVTHFRVTPSTILVLGSSHPSR